MKLVVQRVNRGAVSLSASGEITGRIEIGFFILVGIGKSDTETSVRELAEKVLKLRIMADKEGKMNLSLKDTGGSVLAVSQFTLYADTKAGNRPSFIDAAEPGIAEKLYDLFVDILRREGIRVETGKFGGSMTIDASLNGPVTILLEN